VWGGTIDSKEKEDKLENDNNRIAAEEEQEENETGSDKNERQSPIDAALDPISLANHNKNPAASHSSRSLSGSFLHSVTGGGSSSSLGSNWLSNIGDDDDDNESGVPVPTDVNKKNKPVVKHVVAENNNNFDLELGLPKEVVSDNSEDDLYSDDLDALFGQSDSDEE
jgi:hypothetical protein